jgi:SAM-dependent methyltransferase
MPSLQAQFYHRHHQEYQGDISFWLALAEKYGDPVLELGCGTGRVLLRLLKAGYSIWGLDHDADVLAVLSEQVAEEDHPEFVLHEGDMTGFQLSTEFPLIILPCNTYSTLNGDERVSTLEAVNLHLPPGGVLAVSMPNPERLAQLPVEVEPEVETSFEHPNSGNPVQVSSAWRRVGNEVVVNWHYDHLFPDGRVERSTTEARHFLTEMKVYLGEFLRMGWDIKTYGDFQFTPYNFDSAYLILVGTKSAT